MNGHHTVVELTDKNPTTQILTSPPQPLRSTLRPTQSNNASSVGSENKAKVQATLASYFQQKSGPKKENKEPGTSSGGGVPRVPTMTSILDEAAAVSATPAGKSQSVMHAYYCKYIYTLQFTHNVLYFHLT